MKFPPISERAPFLLHGADYNPDQWLLDPDILAEDIRLMKLAKCNVMSVGIFSWAAVEPEEGKFTFGWLDSILNQFSENGIYAFLATPSGARPAWMSQKYPEVLRVEGNRVRNLHGLRHNHCYTSPIYREKVAIINSKLAERYSNHPAVIGWHISNEYGGECHCSYCQQAFREYLKGKYQTLENLNQSWWTSFWSHTYSDWSQIESPAPHGENYVHAMNLDWKRFVTDQTVDFCKHEIAPLREKNQTLPVTTNFMETYDGLNYWKFADLIDIVSWDAYPTWHNSEDEVEQAVLFAFNHDLFRSIKKGKPFMLMESTPSMTNWQPTSTLKKPGMHLLSSIQAVAHGSDTVQYFQWRQSRGSSEKFHGAVVSHAGHEHTRVFKDVSDVGNVLENIAEIVGTTAPAEVAIIFDWENRWAINDAQGPRNIGIHYEKTVRQHYKALWEQGVSVDIISSEVELADYKLVIAPMLYMIKDGVGEKIEEFVENGGTFVTTYWSGIVDENDLCFLGGFPGPLRKTLGIWSEEIDSLHDGQTKTIAALSDTNLIQGEYTAFELCDLIHLEGAEKLAEYTNDFYAGRPALTVNKLGKGQAYYIASRNTEAFHRDFYSSLVKQTNITKAIDTRLPLGMTVQRRTDGVNHYIFVLNFTNAEQILKLDGKQYVNLLTNEIVQESIELESYGFKVLKWSDKK